MHALTGVCKVTVYRCVYIYRYISSQFFWLPRLALNPKPVFQLPDSAAAGYIKSLKNMCAIYAPRGDNSNILFSNLSPKHVQPHPIRLTMNVEIGVWWATCVFGYSVFYNTRTKRVKRPTTTVQSMANNTFSMVLGTSFILTELRYRSCDVCKCNMLFPIKMNGTLVGDGLSSTANCVH